MTKCITSINTSLSFWLMIALCFVCLFSTSTAQALQCDANPGNTGNQNENGDITGNTRVQYYRPANGTVAVGATSLTLNAAPSGLAANDMVLVMQMQDASINSDNTNSYGDGVSGDPASGYLNNADFRAGFYEYAAIASVSGTTINFKNPLVHSYRQQNANATRGQRRYQIIRVPQYQNLTLTGNITAKAWDGYTGGVLPLDVSGTLNFNGRVINMNEKGFRGGGGLNHQGGGGLTNTDYRVLSSNITNWGNGSKGEGIAGTPRYIWDGSSNNRTDTGIDDGYPNGSYAMGAPGNAGGGGTDGNPGGANDQNSGGGGGGNGGAGGRGGNSWNTNLPTGGWGGSAFPAAANRLVLGGGAGAGTMNNSTATPYGGPHGGVGGGIVLIRAGALTGTGTINANGGNGITPRNDGAGGGGAGGSVLVIANSQTGSLTINAKGGNGGNVNFANDPHGPGGGGGGGVILTNSAVSATMDPSQGQSGMAGSGGGPFEYFGATPSGGVAGNGVANTPPDAIDGTSPGANCQQYDSDLSISKTRNSGSMVAGGAVQFKITVTNHGPDNTRPAATIIVSDVLDSRFSYTGFIGANWSCSGAPNLVCNYTTTLANGATTTDLLINATIDSEAYGQNVSNTASVSLAVGHNNSDPVTSNNNSTIDDIIYNVPAAGSKWLYVYPNNGNRKLSRTVPTTNETQAITQGNQIDITLIPTLSKNLNINGNVMVRLCMDMDNNLGQQRKIQASLWRGTAPSGTQIGSTADVYFSNDTWLFYIFQIAHTGTTTVNSGQGLFLRIRNDSAASPRQVTVSNNGTNTQCLGTGASRVEIDTNTVINVDSVSVYDAPYPLGNALTRMLQGQTVYVRSTVSDPFGYADINNDSFAEIMDGLTVIGGPYSQTNVLSQSGSTKQFEYQVTLPGAPNIGHFDARVTANEGTEGEIAHIARTDFELTNNPDLSVTKSVDKASAAPNDDVEYTIVVANNQNSATGDARQVVVSDKVPRFVKLKVSSVPVIAFVDAPTPYVSSGLTVDSIEYSNDNGTTWVYTPVADVDGFDSDVTNFRVNLLGVVPPNGGFQLKYTMRVK